MKQKKKNKRRREGERREEKRRGEGIRKRNFSDLDYYRKRKNPKHRYELTNWESETLINYSSAIPARDSYDYGITNMK